VPFRAASDARAKGALLSTGKVAGKRTGRVEDNETLSAEIAAVAEAAAVGEQVQGLFTVIRENG
jgi:hypothetical protein